MRDYVKIPVEIAKNFVSMISPLRSLREKHSCKRSELLKNINRPFQICQNLLNRGKDKINLEGKTVLEVGPGNSLGIGLILLALGAKKVYFIDKFKHIFWDKEAIAFHRKLFSEIVNSEYPYREVVSEAVSVGAQGIELNSNLIEYRLGDAAKLPVENKSIDFVFSNAVLEHVHKPEAAVKETARITKAGGLNYHEIDLRDHFFQSTPLRLLRYSDVLWNLMTWYRPGYTNRLRFSEWIEIFDRYFQIEIVDHTTIVANNIALCDIKLHKKFNKYPLDEFGIMAFWVLLSK